MMSNVSADQDKGTFKYSSLLGLTVGVATEKPSTVTSGQGLPSSHGNILLEIIYTTTLLWDLTV